MRRVTLAALVLALVSVACSTSTSDTTTPTADSASTTTTTEASATTTDAPATTTAPETTTTTTATTTSEAVTKAVPPTPVIGVLAPYSEGGVDLFPVGSVEAHWYQWQGLYVVLYRGFDASDGSAMCPGNSVLASGTGFANITNSPHMGEAEDICEGAVKIADAPSGVYACDTLLYYLTEIPTDVEGELWGTLEFGDGEWNGQTSQAATDVANTPDFEPGLGVYELPPSDVDPGGVVVCG